MRTLVQKHSAVVLEADKQYLVEMRLLNLAHREGLGSVPDLLHKLRARPHGDMERKVIDAMMTNETMFFRDPGLFEVLRRSVLPQLLTRRAAERRLTLWCGACSSGQEPYSVAILLREHFPELSGWTVSFIASDISADVLSRAREGRYNHMEISRGMPAAHQVKYFHKQGTSWQVRYALGRIRRRLRSDGYLFFGGAETSINIDPALAPVLVDKTVYYQPRRT